MIRIIDGNNYFRRLVHVGSDARSTLNDFHMPRDRTIIVWDGERGSRRRRAIYPQYKTNRAPLDKDISLHFATLVRVLTHCDVTQVVHQEYEGDDIVAALARNYAAMGERVHIESTDADFLQIVAEHSNLVTTTAVGKTIPGLTKLYKIWVGDASDKISGIPGFGEKAWDEINHADLNTLTEVALKQGRLIELEGLPSRAKPTVELIKVLDEIVSFYPVPTEELTIIPGRPDYAAADAFLKEFFL